MFLVYQSQLGLYQSDESCLIAVFLIHGNRADCDSCLMRSSTYWRSSPVAAPKNFFLGGGLSPFPPHPLPPFPIPFPSPSLPPLLPFPPLPSPSLRSRPPLLGLGGLGERFSFPSGSGWSPAAKRILVHFELKSRHMVATIFRTFLRIN